MKDYFFPEIANLQISDFEKIIGNTYNIILNSKLEGFKGELITAKIQNIEISSNELPYSIVIFSKGTTNEIEILLTKIKKLEYVC